MMAMAAKGRRDQAPRTSIKTPQISAMMAKRNPRVSVTINEPPYVKLSVISSPSKSEGGKARQMYNRSSPSPVERD
jgi:hypothetical protein